MKDKLPKEDDVKVFPPALDNPSVEAVDTDELSENDLETVSGGGDSGDSSWKPF